MSAAKVGQAADSALDEDIRRALDVDASGGMEVIMTEGGTLLASPSAERRRIAWERIEAARRSVQPTPEQAAKPVEEQEEEIMTEVVAMRREDAAERRRR